MAVIYGPTSGGAYIPGTAGDDTIYAYGNGNTLYGAAGVNYLVILNGGSENNLVAGPGTDHLDGGSGTGNLASYQLSSASVTASLANPSLNTGDAAGDTYTNIHGLTGSPYGGTYYGDNSGINNQLWALGGTNNLFGGTSYTTFISGPGADNMVAGSGGGFVDYEVSHSGVTASLLNPAVNTGEAAGDAYSGLHNIGGSGYDDTLIADNSGDNMLGGAGNNTLIGGNGNDTLNGGPGANTLYGGLGSDFFVFGGSAIGPGDVALDPNTILTNASHGIYSTIMDFDQSSGHFNSNEYDSLDVAQLVSTQYNHGNGQPVSSLVRVVEDSSNSFAALQVDTDGTGANWLTLAHLNGVPGGASVHVILDDSMTSGVSLTVPFTTPVSSPNPVDHNNDVLWFNTATGQTDFWDITNGQWSASFSAGSFPGSGISVAGIGHFYGTGPSDILWFNSNSGDLSEWRIADGQWAGSVDLGAHPGTGWQVAGTGDFNGDGTSDVLWFNASTGQTDDWQLSSGQYSKSQSFGSHPGAGWVISSVGDFNGDHTSDILWSNTQTGETDIWKISNGVWAGSTQLGAHAGAGWQIAGTGDFNGDGTSDVLWYNAATGQTDIWKIINGNWAGSVSPGTHPGTGWSVSVVADLSQDGQSDILFHNSQTGDTDIWKISNGNWAGSSDPGAHPGSSWVVAGAGDFTHF